MLKVANIKVGIEKEIDLKKEIAKFLKIKESEIVSFVVKKKSVDARNKDKINILYTVNVELKNEKKFAKYKVENKDVSLQINSKNKKEKSSPIVVGLGPAGLFAALVLAREGLCPVCLEQGKSATERKKDVDMFWKTGKLNEISNVQFGEGGAGTFSDGKLTTLINSEYGDFVLEEFVKAGAPKEILYMSKPHVGTDILINVVQNIRKEIVKLGGEVYFGEKVIDIGIQNGEVSFVKTDTGKQFKTNNVILAIGHSARSTFEMLDAKKIAMEAKPFSVGCRIEHLRENIDKAQYGKYAGNQNLKAAEYKLCYHGENKSAYTFCMCPGGRVVASTSEKGRVVTNGMSYHARDLENSNSALLVEVAVEDVPGNSNLKMMYFQRELEEKAFQEGGKNYFAPICLVGDFLEGKVSTKLGSVTPSYKPGYTFADMSKIFPKEIIKTMQEAIKYMDTKLKGFADKDAVLTAVESRSSSPVRIKRGEDCESITTKSLYPCGEGAGYAGGIMSAACDGIRCAIKILEK